MMRTRLTLSASIVALLLVACGRAQDDPGAGGLTVGEAEALDRAAERLDSRFETPGASDSRELEQEIRSRIESEHLENPSD